MSIRLHATVAFVTLAAGFAAANPADAAAKGRSPAIARHEVHARIAEPGTGQLAVEDDVVLGISPKAGEPWRFLLHRGLAVSEIRLLEKPLRFVDTGRFDPRSFWERPPYEELAGFEVAREITVSAPAGGWGRKPKLRIVYAGVVADSLHEPVREYGRSFETTSGRIVEQGAFLCGATFWVPWSGADLFTFDLEVECPGEWRAISQGDLVVEKLRNGNRVTAWRCPHPSPEIYVVAGPYRKAQRRHGAVSLETWCYADTDSTVWQPYLDAAGAAIDRFASVYGKYPFSKFALVENYWQSGYGMPSFTLLGSQVIRLPFIVHTSFPHEILHNWWGNGVYVDAEQGNWCEGLTTYGADYAAKEFEGGTAARDYRRDQLIGYRDFAQAGGRDFALASFRERASGATEAVGYGKTLMVFHMLRRSIGQDAFDASLRRLFAEYRFRFAGWDAVRAAFEKESRRNLAAWFDSWIVRPGAPQLSLADVSVSRADGKHRVRGVLVQDAPAFDLEVPLVISGAGRSETSQIRAAAERTPFQIDVDFVPEAVAADPEFHLFRALHEGEIAPTLSGVLGATRVRIVLGSEIEGEIRDALRDVAKNWAEDTTVVVIEEGAKGALEDFDGGTWFFGAGRAARAFAFADLPALPEGGTLVAAGRFRGDASQPAAFFRPAGVEGIASVARKIPHYSKSSWLVFEKDKNVAKGVWDPGDSPLIVRIMPPEQP